MLEEPIMAPPDTSFDKTSIELTKARVQVDQTFSGTHPILEYYKASKKARKLITTL